MPPQYVTIWSHVKRPDHDLARDSLRGVKGRRVLLIDDDEDVRVMLRRLYERNEAEVIEASTGTEGLKALYGMRPDLVLLDVAMPDLDGWRVLDRIRELTDVPVLMLTASDRELEKVRALRAGADDYMTKPFGLQELLARSEALLRRRRSAQEAPAKYADSLVELDLQAAEAQAAGRPLNLTPLEFRLLTAFIRNPNQVLSPDQLLAMAWGDSGFARERVKIYVGYLRSKFRDAGVEDVPIETVRGFGYRYRPPE
jgi:DNA-binding response OmpR family regulator